MKKQDEWSTRILAIVGVLVAFQLARNAPGFGRALLSLGAPCLAGAVLGRLAFRERAPIRATAAWACLLAWLFPPVGMFVSGAVLLGQSPMSPSTRERLLGWVGLTLSIGHAVVTAFRHG